MLALTQGLSGVNASGGIASGGFHATPISNFHLDNNGEFAQSNYFSQQRADELANFSGRRALKEISETPMPPAPAPEPTTTFNLHSTNSECKRIVKLIF